jgi:hypothetical protein
MSDMKKWITVSIAAGLLAICPSALRADNSTNSTANSAQITTPAPNATQKTEDAKKKGAQRREVMDILGMTKADLKGLTSEDRTAKIKDAADKKIEELEKKAVAGSLTDKEQSNLALLKKFERHGHAKAKTNS